MSTWQVAEMRGWEAPYGLGERVVQQVWARGDFLRAGLHVEDGRRLVVRSPGAWNHGPGPDFLGAEVFLDGVRLTGDVEVHLWEEDWFHHGHDQDPAYAQVVLHVVLFPLRSPPRAAVPVCVLLPHLRRDLEELALDAALEARLPAGVGQESGARPEDWEYWSRRRWAAKVERSRVRLAAWGWEEACHTTLLELLGLPLNRTPMLELARAHPWAAGVWPEDPVGSGWCEEVVGWRWIPLRPANHPHRWLRAYAAGWQQDPVWPRGARGEGGAGAWPLPQRGARAETWVREGLAPLRVAVGLQTEESGWSVWHHARVGEESAKVREAAQIAWSGSGRAGPLRNGIVQAWREWEREQRFRRALGGCGA